MIEFFFPILEHCCPLFVQIVQMGLILPRISPSTPVLYSAVTNSFQGHVQKQNTPNPTPKHHFSWPELESGQNVLPSEQTGPQLGKFFEKWTKPF